MSLRRQNIWITGASSGIGEGLAKAFHAAGANLILSARCVEDLERVRDECGGDSDHIKVLPLDLCRTAELPGKAESALRQFGGIDMLLNSAGISQRSLVRETQLDVDRKLMETNFFGPVALAKAILPAMLKQKSGHIAVVSSLAGKFGTPMRSGYAASKHALQGFFDSLRAEVRHDGIHITIICPGYVKTSITLNSLTGDGTKYGKIDDSLAHGMPVEECARLIVAGLSHKKEEILLGGKEKYAVYANRLFPRLFARAVSRAKVI